MPALKRCMVGRSQVPGLHLHLGCSAGPGIRVCAAESLPSSAGHSLSLSRSARVGQLRPFALLQVIAPRGYAPVWTDRD